MSTVQGYYSTTLFLLVALLVSSVVRSDPYDCKEVQCPPVIKCPADSNLRVTNKTNISDDDTRNSIDDDDINNNDETDDIDRRTEHNRRRIPKFMVEKNDNQNHPRELHKRSLQYKRRESIKIVPGGYISLVPESVRYHHQLHRNQHKWKRSTISRDYEMFPIDSAVEECCLKKYCVCKAEKCPLPKCIKPHQVPYQREPGTNIPGSCCPKFQCIDEPNCTNVTGTIYFWMTECTKCMCISGLKICHKECEEGSGCYSKNLKKTFSNGISWQEDPCTQCNCNNGESKCQMSFCKPLNCSKKIKIEGECCSVCAPENKTTIIISKPTEANVPSEAVTTESTTISSTTTPSSELAATTLSSPTATMLNLSSTTPEPSSTTTTTTPNSSAITSSSSPTTTPTPTIASSPTAAINEPTPTVTTVLTTKDLTESTTSSPIFFHAVSTPKPVLPTVAVTSESPPTKISPTAITTRLYDITITETTTPISTVHTNPEHSAHFEIDTESIILYTVIVVLLVICCLFAGLYIHEVAKRQTYSSIPNSDSNLSQMPRRKTEESA